MGNKPGISTEVLEKTRLDYLVRVAAYEPIREVFKDYTDEERLYIKSIVSSINYMLGEEVFYLATPSKIHRIEALLWVLGELNDLDD